MHEIEQQELVPKMQTRATISRKRLISCIAFASVFAVLFIISAVFSARNYNEMRSAKLMELAAVQSGNLTEAIMFGSRQQMLRGERNIFLGGAGVGIIGLLGIFYAVRRGRIKADR